MHRLNADAAIAAVLVMLGVAMAVHARSYQVIAEGGGIGPGFMPFVAGVALAAFSGWTGVRSATRPASSTERSASVEGPSPADAHAPAATSGARAGRVVLVFLLILAACVLTGLVGFLVAFGLLVFVLMAVVERERLWLAAVITAAAVTFCYLVFVRLLQVPLPGGVLGLLGGG